MNAKRDFDTLAGRIETVSSIQSKDSFDIVVHDGDNISISPWALFNRLSYTHILQFMGLDALQRTFYAFEAIRGTWSGKQSSAAERTVGDCLFRCGRKRRSTGQHSVTFRTFACKQTINS